MAISPELGVAWGGYSPSSCLRVDTCGSTSPNDKHHTYMYVGMYVCINLQEYTRTYMDVCMYGPQHRNFHLRGGWGRGRGDVALYTVCRQQLDLPVLHNLI